MQKFKRVTALLLTMLLLLGLLPIAVFAEEVDPNTLEISTPEAFFEFSQMCRYDAYSDGLTVYLTDDIDMTGFDFEDIPIFLGTFNGGGYTISGIGNDLARDNLGLFRLIAQGASVSDLTVMATVKTGHSTIGGIAAVNYGTIRDCHYRGIISGIDAIGGIAGENYGYIISATAFGGVFGESQVGGIAGVNEGTILRCVNYAEVNTDISDFEFTFEDKLVSNINPESDTIDISDIGGIAGSSDGILQNCTNRGAIGYPHVGYNVGGIVGAQSGYITNCTNMGTVQGRKEVGGIVGQFEPHIDTIYTLSKLQELRDELDVFSDLTSLMADDAKESGDEVSGQFDTIGDSIELSKDQLELLIDQTEAMVNDNVDSINEVSVTVADTLDALDPIVDSLDTVIEEFENASYDLADMSDDIGDALAELEGLEDVADEVQSDLATGQSYIQSGITTIQTGASYIQSLTGQLTTESLDLTTVLALLGAMSTYAEAGLADMATGLAYIQAGIDTLTQDGGEVLGATNDELQDAVYYLEEAFNSLGDAMDDLEYTNELVSDLTEDLSNRDEIVFTKLDDDYEATREALSDSLGVVGDNLSALNDLTNSSGDLLVDDMDDVTQQLTDIFDLVLEMMQDVTAFDAEEVIEVDDVSTMDSTDVYAGKVTGCTNIATIDGDINVGGIAGSIAFELSLDMEDDWKTDRDKTQTITRQGVAIIDNCTNTGDVVAKKDGAGGILGYQEFGLVENCTVGASIESTEGNYVGGIVGQSNGYISHNFAKTTLSGTQFVGGIAGFGYDIRDCYSLSAVTATDGGLGGIVGDLDTEGTLKNNFFVSDTLGGLDGISFRGQAETIAYDALLQVEGLPDIFSSMALDFYVDDKLIDTVFVHFGEALQEEDYPIIPEKAGYYSQWEDFVATHITSDLKINGDYIPLLTTLSGVKNEAGISTVLADGAFTNSDTLLVEQTDTDYTIWVEGDNTAITCIRYLAPDETVTIQIEQDGQWVEVDATLDGLYLHIPVDTDGAVHLRVVPIATDYTQQLYMVAGALVLLVIGVIGHHKGKTKPKDEVAEIELV